MDLHRPNSKLVSAFQAGDDKFFSLLFLERSPSIRWYCRRFAADRDEEDDLVQDTWVLVWEKRASYRGRGSLRTWLLRVSHTICMRSLTKRRSFVDMSSVKDLQLPSLATIEEAVAKQNTEDDQLSRVLALPLRRRQVVLFRLLEGLSTEETARIMGCARGTVKATLHQALRSLRAAIAHQCLLSPSDAKGPE